ncbi:hypothetical protein J5TS2_26030 [Brevibacillus halotolerans]|uniref:Uncharacterized protein n=1 Tax=Brevibacillus laterosporus TaxID=1465 RepID=A0A0F6XZ12_BRELA|nr:hypothetical protein EX87_04265 [Brevibacillus laterosporus]GIO01935.1 hypothetical protein J5TS2_26030 [Brevibacillus halotolerans]
MDDINKEIKKYNGMCLISLEEGVVTGNTFDKNMTVRNNIQRDLLFFIELVGIDFYFKEM